MADRVIVAKSNVNRFLVFITFFLINMLPFFCVYGNLNIILKNYALII
jgi:hypothetical protein